MSAPTPTTGPRVDPSNAEARASWDGDEGRYWVENEALFDATLRRYRRRFFEVAAVSPGDRVLDIGCGTGETTRDAARLARPGSALGVDLSSEMVERARRRAREQGLDNARFLHGDAQVHPFTPGAFDLAQPDGSDVLRRSGGRLHQHRPRPPRRGTDGAPGLAAPP